MRIAAQVVFDAPDQPAKLMELRFWGVRGSIPSPGRHTVAAGGNTTCVSVRHGDLVLVFDAGTGIRLLGNYLEGEDERSRWKGSIFFSHYHWDHIQGLPFFRPAFREENRFHLASSRTSSFRPATYFTQTELAVEGVSVGLG